MKKSLLYIILMLQGTYLCKAQEVEIRVHEVQRGESLERIAAHYGVSQEEIKNNNLFLDKYFYVGQKLNIPIKIVPKVEYTYTRSSHSKAKPTPQKKKRSQSGGGWWGMPNMYASPYPMMSGFANPLLDPRVALMQAQQQMAPYQQQMQENWRIAQQSQEFFEQQNKAGERILREGIPWNTAPIMVETPAYIPSETIGGSTGTFSKGHQCNVCKGSGQVEDNTYLGYASQTKWCDICHAEKYVAHHHKRCQTCGGDGWCDW